MSADDATGHELRFTGKCRARRKTFLESYQYMYLDVQRLGKISSGVTELDGGDSQIM